MKPICVLLEGVSISTNKLQSMAHFYNTVFEAQLREIVLGDIVLYEGQIGDINITLSPTSTSNLFKRKNGHQLSFQVSDIEQVIARVKQTNGAQLQRVTIYDTNKYCGIVDPDGNTIELIEPISN